MLGRSIKEHESHELTNYTNKLIISNAKDRKDHIQIDYKKTSKKSIFICDIRPIRVLNEFSHYSFFNW